MKALVRLFALMSLVLAGMVTAVSTAVATEVSPISVTVQGCVATVLNVPDGGVVTISGTVGDQDFSTHDNPATLVAGTYSFSVAVSGENVASGSFEITTEGCAPVQPSPSPSANPSPVACGTAASSVRCPRPTHTPKPPTTGVGPTDLVWQILLVGIAVGLALGLSVLALRRRNKV